MNVVGALANLPLAVVLICSASAANSSTTCELALLTLNVRSSVLNGFTLFCACCLLCASASSNPLRTFHPEL